MTAETLYHKALFLDGNVYLFMGDHVDKIMKKHPKSKDREFFFRERLRKFFGKKVVGVFLHVFDKDEGRDLIELSVQKGSRDEGSIELGLSYCRVIR